MIYDFELWLYKNYYILIYTRFEKLRTFMNACNLNLINGTDE